MLPLQDVAVARIRSQVLPASLREDASGLRVASKPGPSAGGTGMAGPAATALVLVGPLSVVASEVLASPSLFVPPLCTVPFPESEPSSGGRGGTGGAVGGRVAWSADVCAVRAPK